MESYTAVMDPDDLRDTGDANRNTEGVIRIVDQAGEEVDVIAYLPHEEEDQGLANANESLRDSPWRPAGGNDWVIDWALDEGDVRRVAVEPRG